jgi:hypothetical protein
MVDAWFTQLEQSLFGMTGNYFLIAIGIIAFFLIVFMLCQIDFRFSILMIAPLGYVMATKGWFNNIYGFTFIGIVIVLGGFVVWNTIRER